MNLRRIFLKSFVAAFSAAALLAICVLAFGTWDELAGKVFITTISIGVYSLIALCCASVYPRNRQLATLGIICCGVGLAFAILTNWGMIESKFSSLFKLRFFFLNIAMALASTALIIRIEGLNGFVSAIRSSTLIFIWATAGMMIMVIFYEGSEPPIGLLKPMAICSILALLGVVLTPILKRTQSK